MPRALLPLFLVPLAWTATGCTRYDCATYTVLDHTMGEQCGPLGANGVYYFEEGVATISLDPDFADDFGTEASAFWMDTMPAASAVFDASALEDGGEATLIEASCRRSDCYTCAIQYWTPVEMRVTVVGPSDETMGSGRSWELEWSYTCPPEAGMSGEGADVVEFTMQSTGYYNDPPPMF